MDGFSDFWTLEICYEDGCFDMAPLWWFFAAPLQGRNLNPDPDTSKASPYPSHQPWPTKSQWPKRRSSHSLTWSCCATRVDRDGFFLRKDREKIIGKHHIPPTTKDMEGENLGEECR